MKKLIIILTLCLLFACTKAQAIEQDQAAHFAVSWAMSQAMGRVACDITPHDRWACFIFPTLTTVFIGIMYEFAKPSADSVDDILWDTMGAAGGAGFNLLFEF